MMSIPAAPISAFHQGGAACRLVGKFASGLHHPNLNVSTWLYLITILCRIPQAACQAISHYQERNCPKSTDSEIL